MNYNKSIQYHLAAKLAYKAKTVSLYNLWSPGIQVNKLKNTNCIDRFTVTKVT